MSQERQSDFGASEFERHAAAPRSGMIVEFIYFLKHNKKWWLLPIIIMLLLIGTLVTLSGSALAPFIYTLF